MTGTPISTRKDKNSLAVTFFVFWESNIIKICLAKLESLLLWLLRFLSHLFWSIDKYLFLARECLWTIRLLKKIFLFSAFSDVFFEFFTVSASLLKVFAVSVKKVGFFFSCCLTDSFIVFMMIWSFFNLCKCYNKSFLILSWTLIVFGSFWIEFSRHEWSWIVLGFIIEVLGEHDFALSESEFFMSGRLFFQYLEWSLSANELSLLVLKDLILLFFVGWYLNFDGFGTGDNWFWSFVE